MSRPLSSGELGGGPSAGPQQPDPRQLLVSGRASFDCAGRRQWEGPAQPGLQDDEGLEESVVAYGSGSGRGGSTRPVAATAKPGGTGLSYLGGSAPRW